jgi:hypothetical protein
VKYAKGNRSDIDGKEKRRLKNRTILLMAPKESGSVSGGHPSLSDETFVALA